MGNVVLPDSSFYIDELRQGRNPLHQLRLLADSHEIAVCGAVCCEVGRGMRIPSHRAALHSAWQCMLYIPTDNRLWQEAEELLWSLDRKGRQIPLADALIACCSLRTGAIVLTLDRHFSSVPGLKVAASIRELLGL